MAGLDYVIFKKATTTASLPRKQSELAAGFDLHADLGLGENAVVYPGRRVLIPTGIQVALPRDTYMRIAPRSGLALKYGIDVLAGVVDADYRGDVGVILINHGEAPFYVNHGDRVAQGIIERLFTASERIKALDVNDPLPDSIRGDNGFGSTGK